MEKQQTPNFKRKISVVLCVLTAVFALSILVFPYVQVVDDQLSIPNGNFFNFDIEYRQLTDSIGNAWTAISLVVIVAVISEIAVYVSLMVKKSPKIALVEKVFVAINFVLVLVFMIGGLSAKGQVETLFDKHNAIPSIPNPVTTSAVVPFVIVGLLAVAYVVVQFAIKEPIPSNCPNTDE